MAAENGCKSFAIRVATREDLKRTLSWLRREWDGHEGFYGNRKLITIGQRQGNLSVMVRTKDEMLVGFLLSDDKNMELMEIKPRFRLRGLGRMLAQHGLARIEASGARKVLIQCMPETSLDFWKTLGFRRTNHPWKVDGLFASLTLRPTLTEIEDAFLELVDDPLGQIAEAA